jgi:hypothetical protein
VEQTQTEVPDDEFARGTPRSTAGGFLNAARSREFERRDRPVNKKIDRPVQVDQVIAEASGT